MPRLSRLQEETKPYPNESSRQRLIINIKTNGHQREQLITIFRTIMEIWTRDGTSANYTTKKADIVIDPHKDRAISKSLKRERKESSHIATESRQTGEYDRTEKHSVPTETLEGSQADSSQPDRHLERGALAIAALTRENGTVTDSSSTNGKAESRVEIEPSLKTQIAWYKGQVLDTNNEADRQL